MFSGINEILLIAAVVLAVIFIPRITKSRIAGRPQPQLRITAGFRLSGRQRLAVLATLIWLAFWAVYYEPWGKDWKLFAYIGAGPVLITWGLWWTMAGRRRL
jgi:hypothetical protein